MAQTERRVRPRLDRPIVDASGLPISAELKSYLVDAQRHNYRGLGRRIAWAVHNMVTAAESIDKALDYMEQFGGGMGFIDSDETGDLVSVVETKGSIRDMQEVLTYAERGVDWESEESILNYLRHVYNAKEELEDSLHDMAWQLNDAFHDARAAAEPDFNHFQAYIQSRF
jgi:hypothetical protein